LLWTVAFALNLATPLMFGWPLTNLKGQIGLASAATTLLIIGWSLCVNVTRVSIPLVVGGFGIALTQLIPLLQLIVGMIGIRITRSLGLVTDNPKAHNLPQIHSVAGGFLVTFITGGILMAAGAVFGLAIWQIIPKRWWYQPNDRL
jgi:hypothetical protein